MKNFFYTLVSIASIFFFTQCENEPKYIGTDFKNLGTIINGDTIITDIPCTAIVQMYVVDSLIVLQCFNTIDNKFAYVYNEKDGKFICSFGNIGRGPGELDFCNMTFRPDSKSFHFVTSHTLEHNIFYIDSILNGNYTPTSIPLCNRLNCDVYPFSDSLMLSTANFFKEANYRFSIMKSNGDTIIGYRDGTKRRTPVVIKPDYKKLFTYTNGALETEVFNLTRNSIKLASVKRYIKPEEKLEGTGINQDYPGITDISKAGNKYIYSGWTKSLSKAFPNKLIVFDWNGVAVGTIAIENNPAFRYVIEVNEADKIIYIPLETKSGQLNIVRYDMSHLPL
ncbi:MAG: hypothetical protein IKY70_08065 [Bacteroidales bacterium]|nr:hypothetical protein [Bacteroidales bacterium]